MNDKNIIILHGWMINGLKLKGNELMTYAIIYGFSQDGQSSFKGSSRYVAKWINSSSSTAHKVLKELEIKGYIESVKINNSTNSWTEYRCTKIEQGCSKTERGCTKTEHNNNTFNNKEYIIIKGVKVFDFMEYVDYNLGIYINSIIREDKEVILNEFFKENIQKEFNDINHLRSSIRKHLMYRNSPKKSGAINTSIKDYKENKTYTGKEKELEELTLKSYEVLKAQYPHNKKLPHITFLEYHTSIKTLVDRYDIDTYKKVFNKALDDEFHKVNFTDMKYLERNFEKILNKL